MNTQQEVMSGIFRSFATGIVVIDSRGIIQDFNPAAGSIFGYKDMEVMGQNISLLMSEPNRSRHDGYIAKYLVTGEKYVLDNRREVKARNKKGEEFPILLFVTEMIIGGKRMFIGNIIDLTAQKAAEQLALEARAAQQAAEEADRLKSEFLAAVSHELRTPLGPIIGFAGLLASKLKKTADSDILEFIEMIIKNAERLMCFVNDLLDLEKIASGRSEQWVFVPVRPIEIFQRLAREHKPKIDEKKLSIVFHDESEKNKFSSGDVIQIERVAMNLICNAIKFAHPEGEIIIQSWQEKDQVFISIANRGESIPQNDLEKIFEPFVQSSVRKTHDGTGLGLALCRKIIEAHRGRIWAACQDDLVVFTFTLPL